MDEDRRDLINQLGAELAGIMEDASADAALMRGVELNELSQHVDHLLRETQRASALASAMQALLSDVSPR